VSGTVRLANTMAYVGRGGTANFPTTTSEARRLIRQRAVRVDGERIIDPAARVSDAEPIVIQIGKRRWVEVVFEKIWVEPLEGPPKEEGKPE